MATLEEGWCPPNAQELLEASISVGSNWYELRLPLRTISYTVDRFDDALKDAKALERIFKGRLYLCFKDSEGLHQELIW